ncbi:MAG: bacillithiol system protein YtxJ [Flavobacteriaceae bacterium]|jgi:bacillithiol system protein YtxJ
MKDFKKAETVEEILEHSEKEPVIVLKHSLTCPISLAAHERVVAGLKEDEVQYPIYLVIMQEEKELSTDLAQKLDVKHESPQLIVVHHGNSAYDASHHDIRVEDIPKNIS